MSDLREQARSRFPYSTTQGHDHKAWAKRIMWRDEHGDKTLTTLQIKLAREAIHGTLPAAKGGAGNAAAA